MIVNIIVMTVYIACTAFVWYRVGRQKAFEQLSEHFKDASEQCGRLYAILEAYRKKYGEKDNDNEQN